MPKFASGANINNINNEIKAKINIVKTVDNIALPNVELLLWTTIFGATYIGIDISITIIITEIKVSIKPIKHHINFYY